MTKELLLRLIQSLENHAVLMLGPTGYILFCNSSSEEIYGYGTGELIGQHFNVLYDEQASQHGEPKQALRTALSAGRYEDEIRQKRRDGTYFWALVDVTPIYSEQNEFIGFAAISRDMTERLRVEQSLHASEERYRKMVDAVKDYAIFMLDPQGYIVSWNEGAYRIKGYTAQDSIGMHFSRFYIPEDLESEKPRRELEIAVRTGKYEEEGWRVRKDGSRFWANVVITAIFSENRQLLGFTKVTRDLTERRQTELALIESEARNRAIADELRATNQDLQRVNRELESFVYVASHDLQEPLRKIQFFGEILKDKYMNSLSAEMADLTQRMQSAAARMQILVNELLEYSRLGHESVVFEDVSLPNVVQEVVNDLETTIRAKDAVVDVGDLPDITGNKAQLRQLFQNLITNALKFNKPGQHPYVSIRSHSARISQLPETTLDPGYKWIAVEVTDNGIGIEDKFRERIFQMFQRLHANSEYPGTGIGLAICKKVAENHKGVISVSSEPGQGSTFTVYLPLEQIQLV